LRRFTDSREARRFKPFQRFKQFKPSDSDRRNYRRGAENAEFEERILTTKNIKAAKSRA
jgi:hypothetical protein